MERMGRESRQRRTDGSRIGAASVFFALAAGAALCGAPAGAGAEAPAVPQYEVRVPTLQHAPGVEQHGQATQHDSADAIWSLLTDGRTLLLFLCVIAGAGLVLTLARRGSRRPHKVLVAAVGILLIASLTAALPFGTAAQHRPAKFPGLFFGMDPQTDAAVKDYPTMKAGGVDTLRVPIDWSFAEKTPGDYNFSVYDRAIG